MELEVATTPIEASKQKKRPFLVWAIFIGYWIYVFPQLSFLGLFNLVKSEIDPSELQTPDVAGVVSKITGLKGALMIAILITSALGATLLFRMRKSALPFFLGLIALVTIQQAILLPTIRPDAPLLPRVVGGIAGYLITISIPVCVIIYIRRLRDRGMLR